MDLEKMRTSNKQVIIALIILLVVAFLLKDMVNLILLTFIFSFIAYSIQNFLFNKMKKLNINHTELAVIIYLIIVGFFIFALYRYLPILVKQIIAIGIQLSTFNLDSFQGQVDSRILQMLQSTFQSYAQNAGTILLQTAGSVWSIALNILIALVLSLFFTLEKEKLMDFIHKMENSSIGFAVRFYRSIGRSFLNSFGKVMQVQITIASINSILSVGCLMLLGFPQVLGLGFMIFILGLIPVAGVIISFIPLSIIAYSLGGFLKVIYLIVIILALHALESYVLNPKLMSMRTKLPVFLTFVILIVSEHFFKIWGLLFGVPLFIFIMDLLQVKLTEEKSVEPGGQAERNKQAEPDGQVDRDRAEANEQAESEQAEVEKKGLVK